MDGGLTALGRRPEVRRCDGFPDSRASAVQAFSTRNPSWKSYVAYLVTGGRSLVLFGA